MTVGGEVIALQLAATLFCVQEAANAQLISLSFIIHLFILSGVRLQLTHFYLLWIFSSTFSAQKAFTSKSTPQA